MTKISELLQKAQQIYLQNFPQETCFERAIFFSWDCSIKDCGFCYMSAHTKRNTAAKIARRSQASMLAETIICKKLGWRIGFLSGGINAFKHPELKELIQNVVTTYGKKIWLNAGPIPNEKLQEYAPYLEGVVGSIETINPELHKKICPSKPTKPYETMFEQATKLGLKNAATFIIGMGETINDFELLKQFIEKYSISKITFYGLLPHKGTMLENLKAPTAEYQAEWIARTRIEFPTIVIQAGVWNDRTSRVSTLLNAGANTITKFPAISKFGTTSAKELEQQAQKAGRQFNGTLTKMHDINIDEETSKLPFDNELKQKINQKLSEYLVTMKNASNNS